jgi:hypothetical protein
VDHDNEYWSVQLHSDNTYLLVNNLSRQCLNQDWSGGVQHSTMSAYPCAGSNSATNERWVFVRKS